MTQEQDRQPAAGSAGLLSSRRRASTALRWRRRCPVTGVAGLCAILYRLFGVPMGLSNVLINVPIVILGSYKLLGLALPAAQPCAA